jgi:hypothetical protein
MIEIVVTNTVVVGGFTVLNAAAWLLGLQRELVVSVLCPRADVVWWIHFV